MIEIPLTQRAYTLRLRGIDKTNHAWRDAVWTTHEAVNNGAKVFGDWLLTLRGGLDHALADEPHSDPQTIEGQKLIASILKDLSKAKKREEADPTEHDAVKEIDRRRTARIRDRRILLALSWLSVESSPKEYDPHKKFIIATLDVIGALKEILAKRGVAGVDLKSWIDDCEPSLSASKREDADWINRSAMFDAAQEQVGPSLTREEVWDLLEPFFGGRESYLAPINPSENADDDTSGDKDKAKDLVQKSGQWLSSRFGTGKGADFSEMEKVYDAMALWAGNATFFASGSESLHSLAESLITFSPQSKDATGILRLISGPGYKSATRNIIKAWESRSDRISEDDLTKLKTVATDDCQKCKSNTGGKGRRPWSDRILENVESACGFTYLQKEGPARHSEFAVMLDHAARRVSIGHTWIKRAESERQKFKVDAAKIEKVPHSIRAWLDNFCIDRFKNTGAIEAYRIRRRATNGWKEVVARWQRIDGMTVPALEALASDAPLENRDGEKYSLVERARIGAAREADPDIDKPGDIQLFEALATEEAVVVWRINEEATPQHLLDYAAATDALAKQKRFKVPAYRHPDPLSHPVFCDFGNSRWEIRFAVHDAASKLADAKATVARQERELEKGKERLAKAKTVEKQIDAESKLKGVEKNLSESRSKFAWLESRHALSMGLWDGGKLENNVPLRWACKRLTKDFGLQDRSSGDAAVNVTRADRLGRAAVGADGNSPVSILGVFNQADWNGRLQAPRKQLDEIAKYLAKNNCRWDAKAKKMRGRIRWLVSFSAKLQPAGPWMDYTTRFSEDAPAKPFVSRRGEYAVKHLTNDTRAGHAKLILSRLPGLRILSVDLGHRFAAACAVWETLTRDDLLTEITGRTVIAGGISSESLYLHTRHTNQDGKARTTIYRRIGNDKLHPAPWARLDRQFLIKLPGEDKPARAASNKPERGINEVALVAKLAQDLGLLRDEEETSEREVDEFMRRAMRIATFGLNRHGRRAKIAYALNPKCPGIPTTGGDLKTIIRGDEEHIRFLTNALFEWYSLATEREWDGTDARNLWNDHIASLPVGFLSPELPSSSETVKRSRQQKQKEDKTLRDSKLQPIAEYLAKADPSVTLNMYDAWKKHWEDADGKHAVVPKLPDGQKGPAKTTVTKAATGWHAQIRLLTNWIMGRGLPGINKEDAGWKQNVGGLSLKRIATMRSLYQLHKAFNMRPRPCRILGAPKLGETNKGTAQSILDAMEQMREQRVKQLASRITEAALGIGSEDRKHWEEGTKRPRKRLFWRDNEGNEQGDRRFKPCEAVIIENLRNYRPDEMMARRETRGLMTWCSGKVRKYLEEACQLHGLHLREVQAGYTSRQDSRTGAPGIRCDDVPVSDFLSKRRWIKAIEDARDREKNSSKDRPNTKYHEYLRTLAAACERLDDEAQDRTTCSPPR